MTQRRSALSILGHAKVEAALARASALGEGVEKDYDAALRLSRLAVDKGDTIGEFITGLLSWRPSGSPKGERH